VDATGCQGHEKCHTTCIVRGRGSAHHFASLLGQELQDHQRLLVVTPTDDVQHAARLSGDVATRASVSALRSLQEGERGLRGRLEKDQAFRPDAFQAAEASGDARTLKADPFWERRKAFASGTTATCDELQWCERPPQALRASPPRFPTRARTSAAPSAAAATTTGARSGTDARCGAERSCAGADALLDKDIAPNIDDNDVMAAQRVTLAATHE